MTCFYLPNMLPCNARFPHEVSTTRSFPLQPPCSSRHSYLLRDLSCLIEYNPRLVARIIDKELSGHINYRNLEPPLQTLVSAQPSSFGPAFDGTRSKVAFGRWAIPKLKKELNHEDIVQLMLALNSLHDLVHNPEKGYEAVRLGVVDRLGEIMLHEKDFVREKVCMVLYTLANLEAGRRAIIQRYKILHKLALLTEDDVDAVRYKSQLVLEMIAMSPVGATGVNIADFIVLLLRLVGGTPKTENEQVLIQHLITLKALLLRDFKELALEHNAMKIFLEKINHLDEEIVCHCLDCIALLCQIPEGRNKGAEIQLGEELGKKLLEVPMEVKIRLVGALAFATIQSDTRKSFCKRDTVECIMEILENFHRPDGQIMAAKVFHNLIEDPKGKILVKRYRENIKKLFAGDDVDVKRHLNLLLKMLKK